MTEKKPSEIMVTQQGGVVRNVINQLKLILRLMGDNRVSILAKAIPLGAFAYLLFPADLAPNIALPVISVSLRITRRLHGQRTSHSSRYSPTNGRHRARSGHLLPRVLQE